MTLRKYAIASMCAKYNMKHPQTLIANICGVSQPQVSRWWSIPHSSKDSIPADMLKKIADFFECSMEDLYISPAKSS